MGELPLLLLVLAFGSAWQGAAAAGEMRGIAAFELARCAGPAAARSVDSIAFFCGDGRDELQNTVGHTGLCGCARLIYAEPTAWYKFNRLFAVAWALKRRRKAAEKTSKLVVFCTKWQTRPA